MAYGASIFVDVLVVATVEGSVAEEVDFFEAFVFNVAKAKPLVPTCRKWRKNLFKNIDFQLKWSCKLLGLFPVNFLCIKQN